MSVVVDIKSNRLDKFLSSELRDVSRNKIQTLIRDGCISVNDKTVHDLNYYLKFKDEVAIFSNIEPQRLALIADKEVNFSILYEDQDLIVVDKPAGLVVHPGAGNYFHTLVNGLIYRCGADLSSGSDECRPGIVHRIDKDTSGVLVIAKNDQAHADLGNQFCVHSIKRKYVCFCYGVPCQASGKIDAPIGRDKNNRLRMAIARENGKRAISFYKTLRTFSKYASKIECELCTGRTHQIRVHMSHIGHSLIGDSTYRVKNYFIPRDISDYIANFPRQALHAYFLEFIHPRTKEIMRFEIALPNDLISLETMLNTIIT